MVQAILVGRLCPGAPLPSSRELSALLGLIRNTVTSAYLQLMDEDFRECCACSPARLQLPHRTPDFETDVVPDLIEQMRTRLLPEARRVRAQ